MPIEAYHMMGHKENLKKYKEIETTSCILSDHNIFSPLYS